MDKRMDTVGSMQIRTKRGGQLKKWVYGSMVWYV